MILLTWSNCWFHCIVRLMLQEFNVYYFDQRLRTLNNFLISINRFQDFRASDIFKWFIISFTRKYHDSCLAIKFRTEIRKRFFMFFRVFVLTTNESRMHAQKSVEKNVFSSYEMTRYFCTFDVLIIFSLRIKNEFSKSHRLQKSFSSFSSFSSITFQISVRFHDYRSHYELYTSKNKSSKSRILSIDEKKKQWINRFETKLKKNEK